MLESALHDAIFGHGEIAMLAGEPCIGKTPDCPGVVLPRHQIGGSDTLSRRSRQNHQGHIRPFGQVQNQVLLMAPQFNPS